MSFGFDPSTYASSSIQSLLLSSLAMNTTVQRLSTGLRINSAADDPAGLSQSQNLTAQIDGLNQAVQNIQNATSLVQTGEAALNQITPMLQRMQTLATQAANATTSSTDLNAIQSEMNQLAGAITQLTNSTSYNGHNLLSGALQGLNFQLGPTAQSSTTLSIAPMDAASLGVAANAPVITQGKNNANLVSLTGAGTGLIASNQGETYAITSTTLTGGLNGAVYSANGNTVNTATANTNQGSEQIALTAGTNNTGGSLNYQVQVANVDAQGNITAIRVATSTTAAGGTPSWTTVNASPTGTFAISGAALPGTGTGGLTATFSKGAATAQIGDQFTFTVANGSGAMTNALASANVGDETGTVSGTYTGAANLQYTIKANSVDGTNTVNSVVVSTDGGKTYGSQIAISGGTFAIGNGLQFAWGASTKNQSQVAINGDTLSFNAVAGTASGGSGSAQVLQLSDSTTINGVAKYATPALANIGSGALLATGQTTANLGVGTQQIAANFNAVGTTNSVASGTTTFTLTPAQAATVANGVVLSPATAPAGLNVMTPQAANQAIATITNALNTVGLQQGQLGAMQNRLNNTLAVALSTSTQLSTAETNLTSANIPQEMINLTTQRIIQQSAVAILSQSNQIAALYTKLLG